MTAPSTGSRRLDAALLRLSRHALWLNFKSVPGVGLVELKNALDLLSKSVSIDWPGVCQAKRLLKHGLSDDAKHNTELANFLTMAVNGCAQVLEASKLNDDLLVEDGLKVTVKVKKI